MLVFGKLTQMIKKIKTLLRARRIKKIRETPEIYKYLQISPGGVMSIETEDFLKLKKVRLTIEQIMNSSFYKNTFKKTPHS